jgi:hypothetical protein
MLSRRRLELKLAEELYDTLEKILADDLKAEAEISFRICEEIIVHHLRDMDRLYAIHHALVHPTKHCSYLAFWVRKLKPIYKAVKIDLVATATNRAEVEIEHEITNVNEIVAIHCALRNLRTYIADDLAGLDPTKSPAEYLGILEDVLIDFFNEPNGAFDPAGTRGKALVYDMRFRTFGPHHLTHTLVNILREVRKK